MPESGFLRDHIAVLIDFDGTITQVNVLDSLYERFGGPGYRTYMELWNQARISTMEEIEQVFSTIKASRHEMENFLRTVDLSPGFKALLATCREKNYPLAIVSDGLRWYIEYVLDQHGITGVRVYASEIFFEMDRFGFEYPWFDPAYPLRSTAKPLIIQNYQQAGYHVVFVGDGLSDLEAAETADTVYAKDVLLQKAKLLGIDVREYQDLSQVVQDLDDPSLSFDRSN